MLDRYSTTELCSPLPQCFPFQTKSQYITQAILTILETQASCDLVILIRSASWVAGTRGLHPQAWWAVGLWSPWACPVYVYMVMLWCRPCSSCGHGDWFTFMSLCQLFHIAIQSAWPLRVQFCWTFTAEKLTIFYGFFSWTNWPPFLFSFWKGESGNFGNFHPTLFIFWLLRNSNYTFTKIKQSFVSYRFWHL